MSESHHLPEQHGRIMFEGQTALRFWVRTFKLEAEIERIRQFLGEVTQRKNAMVPVVAEFRVNPELVFIYVMVVQVDILGVENGSGIVYWASPQHEKEMFERRDKTADDVLKHLKAKQGGFDEIVEIEIKRED